MRTFNLLICQFLIILLIYTSVESFPMQKNSPIEDLETAIGSQEQRHEERSAKGNHMNSKRENVGTLGILDIIFR